MFTGGVTAHDLARMKLENQREKDAKEKHDKDNTAESGEGESSEPNSHLPFASLVSAKMKDQLGGLEGRLVHVMDSQIHKCAADMGFDRKTKELQSLVAAIMGIEGRIGASVVDSIRNMEAALIKVVTDSLVGVLC